VSLNRALTTAVDHNGVTCRATQQLVELAQRLTLGSLVGVGVDLVRGRDVRVAEDHLSATPPLDRTRLTGGATG
jgi:hypothetical protein